MEAKVLDKESAEALLKAGVSNLEALLDFDVTGSDLHLRGRRSGDRFWPLGLGGSKSLQDFMVNAKIEPWLRDYVPVLTVDDQLAWVAGWRIDERFKITAKTSRVLYIKLKRQTDIRV